MLKVGVFGAGQLGKIHLEQWLQIPDIQVVGFYDPDQQLALRVSQNLGVPCYDYPESLIEACQLVDIASPTRTHFDIAKSSLQKSRHLYIEKPMTHTLEEAELLVKLVAEADVKCKIGHHQQYPASLPIYAPESATPQLITVNHMIAADENAENRAVVTDLMIQDIDFILQWVKAPVRRILANGMAVVHSTIDLATARIEFDDGSVANLCAGKIASNEEHHISIFQQDGYYQINLLQQSALYTQKPKEKRQVQNSNSIHYLETNKLTLPERGNSIKSALEAFVQEVQKNKDITRSVHHGLKVMQIAHQIEQKINYPQRASSI